MIPRGIIFCIPHGMWICVLELAEFIFYFFAIRRSDKIKRSLRYQKGEETNSFT